LSVLSSYSVVKEPTYVERAANLPDPPVRVKQNVSVLDCFAREPIPVDPDLTQSLVSGVGKIVTGLRQQEPQILGSEARFCQTRRELLEPSEDRGYSRLAILPTRLRPSLGPNV
jgi:hypothetical protein